MAPTNEPCSCCCSACILKSYSTSDESGNVDYSRSPSRREHEQIDSQSGFQPFTVLPTVAPLEMVHMPTYVYVCKSLIPARFILTTNIYRTSDTQNDCRPYCYNPMNAASPYSSNSVHVSHTHDDSISTDTRYVSLLAHSPQDFIVHLHLPGRRQH
jgi:hypothetical protein